MEVGDQCDELNRQIIETVDLDVDVEIDPELTQTNPNPEEEMALTPVDPDSLKPPNPAYKSLSDMELEIHKRRKRRKDDEREMKGGSNDGKKLIPLHVKDGNAERTIEISEEKITTLQKNQKAGLVPIVFIGEPIIKKSEILSQNLKIPSKSQNPVTEPVTKVSKRQCHFKILPAAQEKLLPASQPAIASTVSPQTQSIEQNMQPPSSAVNFLFKKARRQASPINSLPSLPISHNSTLNNLSEIQGDLTGTKNASFIIVSDLNKKNASSPSGAPLGSPKPSCVNVLPRNPSIHVLPRNPSIHRLASSPKKMLPKNKSGIYPTIVATTSLKGISSIIMLGRIGPNQSRSLDTDGDSSSNKEIASYQVKRHPKNLVLKTNQNGTSSTQSIACNADAIETNNGSSQMMNMAFGQLHPVTNGRCMSPILCREVITPTVRPDGSVYLERKLIICDETATRKDRSQDHANFKVTEVMNNPLESGVAKKFVVSPANNVPLSVKTVQSTTSAVADTATTVVSTTSTITNPPITVQSAIASVNTAETVRSSTVSTSPATNVCILSPGDRLLMTKRFIKINQYGPCSKTSRIQRHHPSTSGSSIAVDGPEVAGENDRVSISDDNGQPSPKISHPPTLAVGVPDMTDGTVTIVDSDEDLDTTRLPAVNENWSPSIQNEAPPVKFRIKQRGLELLQKEMKKNKQLKIKKKKKKAHLNKNAPDMADSNTDIRKYVSSSSHPTSPTGEMDPLSVRASSLSSGGSSFQWHHPIVNAGPENASGKPELVKHPALKTEPVSLPESHDQQSREPPSPGRGQGSANTEDTFVLKHSPRYDPETSVNNEEDSPRVEINCIHSGTQAELVRHSALKIEPVSLPETHEPPSPDRGQGSGNTEDTLELKHSPRYDPETSVNNEEDSQRVEIDCIHSGTQAELVRHSALKTEPVSLPESHDQQAHGHPAPGLGKGSGNTEDTFEPKHSPVQDPETSVNNEQDSPRAEIYSFHSGTEGEGTSSTSRPLKRTLPKGQNGPPRKFKKKLQRSATNQKSEQVGNVSKLSNERFWSSEDKISNSNVLRDSIVRKTIQDCYLQGVIPTIDKIHDACCNSGLELAKTSVVPHLTSIGYKWVACKHKKLFLEDHRSTAERIKYMNKLEKHQGKNLVFIFVSAYVKRNGNAWQVSRNDVKRPSLDTARVVLHALSNNHLLEGGLEVVKIGLFGLRRNDIMSWLKCNVIPNIPQGSVVIFGHHPLFDKDEETEVRPNIGCSKEEIVSWLISHKVPSASVNPDVPKAVLLCKVDHVILPKTSIFDKVISQNGFIPLHLPKHHKDLNPVEFIWQDILEKLYNTPNVNSVGDLEDFISQEFSSCPQVLSSVACDLVRNFGCSYREFDLCFDELIEKFLSDTTPVTGTAQVVEAAASKCPVTDAAKVVEAAASKCPVTDAAEVVEGTAAKRTSRKLIGKLPLRKCPVCLKTKRFRGSRCSACRNFWRKLQHDYNFGEQTGAVLPVCQEITHTDSRPPDCLGCRRHRYELALFSQINITKKRPSYVLPIPPVTEMGRKHWSKILKRRTKKPSNLSSS